MAKKTTQEIHQEITDQIIEAIENGFGDDGKWVRPWNVSNTFPTNITTGKQYNGINAIILMILCGGGNFAGYGQWKKELKAQVRKGSTGIMITVPLFRKTDKVDSKGQTIMIPYGWKQVPVFHSDAVDGWDEPIIETNDTFEDHTKAEQTISYMKSKGCEIRHAGDRCFFSGGFDFVQMPLKSAFPEESDYYASILHELVHWTGHSSRLNRQLGDKYGRKAYAFEELVAELGASILCGELGIHNGYREDHAKYINGWLDIMKGDSSAIIEAGKLASKAVNVIMGRLTIKGETLPTTKPAIAA